MTDTNTAAALSADADGWILAPEGGWKEHPAPDLDVEFRFAPDADVLESWFGAKTYVGTTPEKDIIAYRPATPAPAALEGSSSGEGELVAVPRWVFTDFLNNQPGWPDTARRYLNAPALQPSSAADAKPVAVTISCPVCDVPHIDEGEWATTRHHKTHQCQSCGHEWRPFPFTTVGIAQPHPSQQAGTEGEATYSQAEFDECGRIGERDGYESAIQDLDLATGGDGEFRGSTDPSRCVDVETMKARIIERFAALKPVER